MIEDDYEEGISEFDEEDHYAEHDTDCRFKRGQKCYIASSFGSIPSNLINKPLTVTGCFRIPVNQGEPETWQVEVRETPLLLMDTDLAKSPPF